MSWNFSGSGNNEAETLKSFRDAVERDTYCPFHDVLVASAEALAARLPANNVRMINTFGHINADGTGNVKIGINC